MGSHWELRPFVIVPTTKYPVVLGYRWLVDHDPLINWSQQIIHGSTCASHHWDQNWGPNPPAEGEAAALTQEEVSTILPQYHDILWLFEEQEADELPPHRSTDCVSDLIPGEKLPCAKLYSMSSGEKAELQKYLDKNLARGVLSPLPPPIMQPQLCLHRKRMEACDCVWITMD